jgi:hypothetical protein
MYGPIGICLRNLAPRKRRRSRLRNRSASVIYCRRGEEKNRSGNGTALLVLDHDRRSWVGRRHGELPLPEQVHVLLHAPPGLVEAVFDRVPDAREARQLRGEEAEVIRLVRGFDY